MGKRQGLYLACHRNSGSVVSEKEKKAKLKIAGRDVGFFRIGCKHFAIFAGKYWNMEDKDLEQPRMVSSHDIHLDTDYAAWIAELKYRYRSAQVKAAVRVNAEKLLFNWQLGRDLVQKKAEERWGAGVVEQVSLDLQQEFPDADGFSATNLWYMKRWYLFYASKASPQILQRAVEEMQLSINQFAKKLQRPVGEIQEEKLYQAGEEFPLPFALVPWNEFKNRITDN